MKKILIFILTILGIGLSFCSSESYSPTPISTSFFKNYNSFVYPEGYDCFMVVAADSRINLYDNLNNPITSNGLNSYILYCNIGFYESTVIANKTLQYYNIPISNSSGTCEDKNITVFYNSGNTESILCDGTQAIEIKGLSSITSTNTRTPYFNINYRDEDNQLLTESYDKDILYLSGGLYKKTYTGNNDRILNVLNVKQESNFTGYVPVFDVSGSTNTLDNDNVFNNFADNSLKVLLSNIPSYIQYITIFFILLFLFGFIRRFKRKR